MKKVVCFLFLGFVFSGYSFSQSINNVTLTIEITNVVVNGGLIHVSIFSNATSFRSENPCIALVLESDNTVVSKEIMLLAGYYLTLRKAWIFITFQ